MISDSEQILIIHVQNSFNTPIMMHIVKTRGNEIIHTFPLKIKGRVRPHQSGMI